LAAINFDSRRAFGKRDAYHSEEMNLLRLVSHPGRFIVILAAISVGTIVVLTSLLLWQLRGHELRHAEGEAVALSHILAEKTARSLQGIDLALDVALDRLTQAKSIGVSFDEFAIHAMLRSLVEAMPQLRSMFVVDAEGKVASSALSHPTPKYDVKDRDYFTALRDSPQLDLYVSVPMTNRIDGQRTLFVSRRILNEKGEFGGVVAASLSIPYIEALYDSITLDSIGPIALYRDGGVPIAQSPRNESPIVQNAFLPALERGGTERSSFKKVRTEGEDAGITIYRRVERFPLVLAVGNRDYAALESWRDTAGRIAAAAVVNIVLVMVAAAFLLGRQRHESELAHAARESSNQLRAMVNSAMDAIVTVDRERRVVVFNPAAQSMFGYSEEQIRGQPLDRLLPDRFRATHEGGLALFQESGVTARMKDARMDIVGLRADGTEFPIESTIAQADLDGSRMFTAILRDVGDRRRAEDELRESHRQLRELASSLQEVREEERISIARELHDELGQQLLRLRMDLSWLSGRIKNLSPGLLEKVVEMKHSIAGTVDTLRRVTTRLRPPLLDDLGLAEAAQWQLDDFSSQTGIEVVSSIAVDSVALDERISINIFRILQESLTNAARHAEATQIHVTLSATDEGLTLEIRDNGRGMEFGGKRELSHGLVGIRERTLLLGGRMEIATALGEGFSISINVPLNKPESAGEQE
jgi:PAS domain S-box-containing protein